MAGACVGSGFCCKQAPCPFGQWDAEKHQCSYLVLSHHIDTHAVYRCGKYEEILKQPFSDVSPAFGAGCCSPLFNEERSNIRQAMAQKVRTLKLPVIQ